MLTWRRTTTIATVTAAALALCAPAQAKDEPSGGAGCGRFNCEVEVEAPREEGASHSDGGKGGGGSGEKSRWTCTYKLAKPQPPEGSIDWEGHKKGDGAVYKQECIFDGDKSFTRVRTVWLAEPPEAEVDPEVLAQQAVDKMRLDAADIHIAPDPGGKGVVGMPVWVWTPVTPTTWGPNTASATAGGLTITATAKVESVTWKFGDGQQVTCAFPGKSYKESYGKRTPAAARQECGIAGYTKPSTKREGGTYKVTATSTWQIEWAGGGAEGELTEVRNADTEVTIAESQVLN